MECPQKRNHPSLNGFGIKHRNIENSNGDEITMPDSPGLSEARRALLEKYLRGELPKEATSQSNSMHSIREDSEVSSPSDPHVALIPVQTGQSRPPFFYMHVHWIGGAFYSFTLAHDLGPDQPLYVIDPYKFDDLQVPPTIEEIAASYIESIRTVQSEGPYFLGGFCAGGLLAYEVAQQLRARGQEVKLLVLIDPMAGPIQFIRLLGSCIRRFGDLLRLTPAKQLDWFLRIRYLSRILRRSRDENTEHVNGLMRSWKEKHPGRFSLIPAPEALRQDWMAVFVWAVSGYFPRHYPGKLTYLFARENPDSRKLWWGKAGEGENAEIYAVPGTHETCRTTYLHDLTAQVKACLDKVQARTVLP
jgi:thioesterase domain-containing protein